MISRHRTIVTLSPVSWDAFGAFTFMHRIQSFVVEVCPFSALALLMYEPVYIVIHFVWQCFQPSTIGYFALLGTAFN